jgi:hypothetical protein
VIGIDQPVSPLHGEREPDVDLHRRRMLGSIRTGLTSATAGRSGVDRVPPPGRDVNKPAAIFGHPFLGSKRRCRSGLGPQRSRCLQNVSVRPGTPIWLREVPCPSVDVFESITAPRTPPMIAARRAAGRRLESWPS